MAANRSQNVDTMGTNSITRLLVKFSGPAVIANLVTASYNLVDAIFIGRLGDAPLAAIAVANPLMMIYNGLGSGTGIGASSLIGRYFGAKRKDEDISKVVGNAIVSFFIIGGLLTALILLSLNSILSVFGADPSVLPYATAYMFMETSFICVNFLHLTLCEIVRVEGRPNISSAALIVAGVGNCIWDPILGFGWGPFPKMGMAGFALATSVGRLMGISILIYHFMGHSVYKFTWRSFVPDFKVIYEIYSVGISNLTRTAGGAVAQLVANLVAEPFGVTPVALLGIYFRVIGFTGQPCMGIAQGMLPIVAYNYGAHKLQRISEALGKASIAAFSWGALIWTISMLFPRQICSIFSSDQGFLDQGAVAVRIFSLAFFLAALQMVMSYFFQAVGKGFLALIIGATRQILYAIPFLIILSRFFGVNGIWAAFACADTLSALTAMTLGVIYLRQSGIPIFWWRQKAVLTAPAIKGAVKDAPKL